MRAMLQVWKEAFLVVDFASDDAPECLARWYVEVVLYVASDRCNGRTEETVSFS